MRTRHKTIMLIIALFTILSVTGCSLNTSKQTTTEAPGEYSFDTTGETSTLGISESDEDLLDKLTNNTYYVIHNNTYYPVVFDAKNAKASETLDLDNAVDDNRMLFFTEDNEKNIPTLFEGDRLVYYSTDTLLDFLRWERYYDMGYTVGVNNLYENKIGRYYIDLDNTDDATVLEHSELYDLQNSKAEDILFDKIGGTQITKDIVDHGIITGLQKGEKYDVEVYEGTYYKHYHTTANYHAYHAYEMFASTEYKTLQDYIYEVKIPDYFVNGYYVVNKAGVLRIIKGTSYNSDTNFNEQLLYAPNEDIATGEEIDEYKNPKCYSTYPELNQFVSNKEGTLGYLSEEDQKKAAQTSEDEDSSTLPIQASITKDFKLWLPKNKTCTIEISSSTEEKTGNITVTLPDNTTKQIPYDFIKKKYIGTINGKDEIATLTINGFWKGYSVELTNAELYTNQTAAKE